MTAWQSRRLAVALGTLVVVGFTVWTVIAQRSVVCDNVLVELARVKERLRVTLSLAEEQQQVREALRQRAVLLDDMAYWLAEWNVQDARLPANIALVSPMLDALQRTGHTLVHHTSYHFPHGAALASWATHLSRLAPATPRIAVVPGNTTTAVHVEAVHVVDGGALLRPWALCRRDPGSGLKVLAALALLARGFELQYSDADVVWFGAPPALPADCDMAFQIYPGPSDEAVRAGQFGLNFGLWRARPTLRVKALLRRVLRRMVRSVQLSVQRLSFDTCNDQNALNYELRRDGDALCGWLYRGQRHRATTTARDDCVWIALLDPQQFATATPWLTAHARGDGHGGVPPVALHWTGYWGGHTMAKVTAMAAHGQLAMAPLAAQCRRLYVSPPDSLAALVGAFALAIVTQRTLLLPELPCSLHPLRGPASRMCSAHYFYGLDGMLELGRALRHQTGYHGVADVLRCGAACARLPRGPDACPLLVAGVARDASFSTVAWRDDVRQPGATVHAHVERAPELSQVLASLDAPLAAALVAALLAYVEPVAQFVWPTDAAATVAAMLR